MEAFIELLKPCLVLIGPLLFFAYKRVKEFQDAQKLKVHGLTVQDCVEKLTKTPSHSKRIRKKFNTERLLLFEKEKYLLRKCRALESMLQYEIAKSDYLNKLNLEHVHTQRELLREIFCLRVKVKKLRKYKRGRKIVTFKKSLCYLSYDDVERCHNKCQCCTGHADSNNNRPKKEPKEARDQMDKKPTSDLISDEIDKTDESLIFQVKTDHFEDESSIWLSSKNEKLNYYQTCFS